MFWSLQNASAATRKTWWVRKLDLQINVPPVKFSELTQPRPEESSDLIRKRVLRARDLQKKRFQGLKLHANAQMSGRILRKFCSIDPQGSSLLEQAVQKLSLSARAYDRILKVSRTIADLEGSEKILPKHLAEAIHYRSLDRESWS